jgi:hypothetical protein
VVFDVPVVMLFEVAWAPAVALVLLDDCAKVQSR